MDKKILIGLPNSSGLVPTTVLKSLWELNAPEGTELCVIDRTLTDLARNHIVEQFLSEDYTHLFFVDDDMVLEPDSLEKLLAHDLPLVSGLCLSRRIDMKTGKRFPVAYMREEDTYKIIEPQKGLNKIHSVGMACTLIRRDVVESVVKQGWPPFRFLLNDHEFQGEDEHFCERVDKAGFDMFVDSDVRPVHLIGFQGVSHDKV